MRIVAYPCLVMATINFMVGWYHLTIFLKRPQVKNLLPFALLCFCVCCYDLFCIGLYNSDSVEDGVFWQRFQFATVDFISIFLIWFVLIFTGNNRRGRLPFFITLFGVLLLLSFVLGPDATLDAARPSIKYIELPGLNPIIYYESEAGWLYLIGLVSAVASYFYLLVLLVRHYAKSKDKNALLIVVSQITYFFSVVNDSLVVARVYSFIYVSEYGFLIIVLCMSYVLLNEFVGLYKTVEENNLNLEAKVAERTREIRELNEELKHLADLDGLTGIYNRRFFNDYLEIEVKRARNVIEHRGINSEEDVNFGLAIMDIDHFKRINDTYGHPAGDKVLIEIVNEIKRNIFSRDLFCRYGGEEFVVLFTRTSRAGIAQAIEKIRKSIEERLFYVGEDPEPSHITVSVGAVIFTDVMDKTGGEILKLADDSLLAAKNAGRNRIVYYSGV